VFLENEKLQATLLDSQRAIRDLERWVKRK
jgi:hypothetical protein